MKYFWKQWLKITKKIASFFATIILTIVYYIIIVPIGFFLRLVYKEQLLGHGNTIKTNSYWTKKTNRKQDLKWAKEQ